MGAHNREMAHSIRSRVGLLAAALVIVATACGCQQTTPAAEGPWAADIEQARSEWRPTSSFNLSSPTLHQRGRTPGHASARAELSDRQGRHRRIVWPSGQLSVPDQPVGSSISEEQQEEFVHTCSIDAGQPIIEALEFDMRVNPGSPGYQRAVHAVF